MFQVNDIVKPSGEGRTALWRRMRGIVTEVLEDAVFVSWHGLEFEEEMQPIELISIGRFGDSLPDELRLTRDAENDDPMELPSIDVDA